MVSDWNLFEKLKKVSKIFTPTPEAELLPYLNLLKNLKKRFGGQRWHRNCRTPTMLLATEKERDEFGVFDRGRIARPACLGFGCISSLADPMEGFTTMASLVKLCGCFVAWIATLCLMCCFANATVIDTETLTLTSADPTQMGRLSRNGIPQDSVRDGALSGRDQDHHVLSLQYTRLRCRGPGVRFLFLSYGGFIQIDFDSTATTTFLSAYLDAYSPSNLATNWLGDAGTSGNFFGVDPLFFQVVVPSAHDLVLVLNETTTNGGLNLPRRRHGRSICRHRIHRPVSCVRA